MLRIRTQYVLLSGLLALVLGMTQPAQALQLTLKRAVFEGNRRAEVLTIINNSTEEEAYRIGWRPMRMTADDALVTVEEGADIPGLMPADDLVRFAPRRIIVPPGGTQQIRLMLTKPQDLPAGEYRSHLWLQPEAENVKFPSASAEGKQPMVQLKMLTGMTIPVIVRHGETTVKATLTGAQVKPAPDGKGMTVSFTLGRQGNRSLYGDLQFTCGDQRAREIKGIALYTEIHERHFSFDVPYPDGKAGACPVMSIAYYADQDDDSLKGALLASAEIAVP